MAAVNKDTYNILHASPELQMDEEVALAVVNKDGFALKLLPNFKNNKKVVLAAFKDRGHFTDLSEDLKKIKT